MKILGIHIGHDSGATLLIDGKIIADVSEERFVRIKHFAGIPAQSVEYCLKEGKITFEDLDYIAIPSRVSSGSLSLLISDGTQDPAIHKIARNYAKKILRSSISLERAPVYIHKHRLGPKTRIINVEHHLAHAASAYYTTSCRDKQLIVTIDGAGDGYSACIWRGEQGKITALKKFGLDASLGWFYSTVTEALGWQMNDGEGKTMGLAPYGNFSQVCGLLDGFYPEFKSGSLIRPHDFGPVYTFHDRGAVHWHLDESETIKELAEVHGRENIAAEAQRILEEQCMNIIFPWLEKESVQNLSCAGGIFLNVKLNQRIWQSQKIINHHIFPNAGDAGLSLGAALYVANSIAGKTSVQPVNDLYWGPSFSNEFIEGYLKNRNLGYQYHTDIAAVCADLLACGKIIGWFQGRMESGPRALGNRSILMSPFPAENKDIINARVKFREGFRPFCPSLTYESRELFLKNSRVEEFMITSFDVAEKMEDKIPAVVHVDGTVRPQLVRREVNPKYYDMISRFGKITGIPVVLNTSFNIRGEPIVCSPGDAIRCFFDTGMDCLALGDYLIVKTAGNS